MYKCLDVNTMMEDGQIELLVRRSVAKMERAAMLKPANVSNLRDVYVLILREPEDVLMGKGVLHQKQDHVFVDLLGKDLLLII